MPAAAAAITADEAAALFQELENLAALVLAVSGGPDSTALMLLVARWRKARASGPKLIAITVDHGLRRESKREAGDVARLARKLGIDHRTLRWSGDKPKTGLPQAAREARYRLLAGAARKAGATRILTAHTLDDQAETVMIRMMRGSGMTGLKAMAHETRLGALLSSLSPASGRGEEECGTRSDEDIVLLRPLLGIPKARLTATLEAEGVPFADDPTNRDTAFTRARLRGLMPQLAAEGLDAARLSLLARRLRRADAALEAEVDAVMDQLVVPARAGTDMAADDYFQLSAEIALRLLGRAIDAAGDEGPVELAKLEALQSALDNAQNTGTGLRRTLAGAVVTLARGRIVVERAPPRRNTAAGRATQSAGKALTKRRAARTSKPKKR